MTSYKIIVNGTNFVLSIQGKEQRMGFYATRFVEANNVEEAQEAAMRLIMNDNKLRQAIRNEPNSQPQLHIDEVTEAPITEQDKSTNNAFMFYADTN